MAKLKHFTVLELVSEGFKGFQTFQNIRQQYAQDDGGIPKSPGVYVVIRANTSPPVFLAKGFGGTHKARKANSPIGELEANWVPGASVLYFGKASQRKTAEDCGTGSTNTHSQAKDGATATVAANTFGSWPMLGICSWPGRLCKAERKRSWRRP